MEPYLRRLQRHPAYLEMLENRRRAAVEEEGARRRAFLFCICSFVFWPLLTAVLAGWAMHTVRYAHYSELVLLIAVLIGNLGIAGTLIFAYHRLTR